MCVIYSTRSQPLPGLYSSIAEAMEPTRSYLERVYNIQRWTVFPHGGHFAPVEEAAAVAGDLSAFFRGLTSR
jgi:pimeloyl-ACP methyl ester carboxylesterase